MAEYTKPLPVVNDLNKPHWEGAKRHEFLIQKCGDCSHTWFPPFPTCTKCLSTNVNWVNTSGKGNVFSFIVYHQGWLPGYKEDLPYNCAIIELEEGVRFINNLVDMDNKDIKVGMPVQVTFEDINPEVTIPHFKPA